MLKREKRDKMQTAGQQQALFTLSPNLLALTDPYHWVRRQSLTAYALHCFLFALSLSLSHLFLLPEYPEFHFPSDTHHENLTSDLTGNLRQELLKLRKGLWSTVQ